eukprot:g17759.t1
MESASFHDFRIVQELGRGSFGTVYKARWRKDEAQPFLVLKRIDFKPWHQEKHRLAAKKEVQMLSKVRHPNIIRYFGSFTYKGALFICMEFASQGDMHQFIQKRQRKQAYLTEDTLWRFGNQLVSAIAYNSHLHAASIIHRDLKPLNVFLAEGDKVKVGDLGVSKLVEEFDQNHTRVGTPLYDFKVDIWALGCLLYLLTALEPPFFGQNLIQLGNDIVRRNPRSLSGTYSNEWRTLVMQLLTKRPQERPDIFTVEATLRGSDPSGASACSGEINDMDMDFVFPTGFRGIPAQFPTSVRHPANKRPMSAYVRHSTAKHDEAAAPIHPSQLAGGVPSQPVVKSRVPSQSTSSSSSSCRGSKESVTAGGAGPQGSSGVAAAAAAQQSKAPHSVQKVRPLSAPSIRRVPAGGGSSSSSSSHAAAGAAGGASVSGGGTSGPALSSSSASGPPGSGAGSGGGRGTLQHLQMLANVNKLGVGATNTTNKLETEYLDVDPVDDDQCCAGGPLNMSAEDHRVTEDRGGRGTASHGRGEGTLLAGSSSAGTSASQTQPDPPDYSGSGGGATGATGGTAPGQHIMPRRPRPSTAVEHLERTLSSSAAAAPARTAFGVGTTLKTGSRITRPWSAMHRPSVQKPLHLFHAQPVLCNEGVLVTTTSTACSGGGCGTTAGSSTSGANATAAAVCGGGGTSTSTAVPILVATTTVAVGKAKKTRISVHDL